MVQRYITSAIIKYLSVAAAEMKCIAFFYDVKLFYSIQQGKDHSRYQKSKKRTVQFFKR